MITLALALHRHRLERLLAVAALMGCLSLTVTTYDPDMPVGG